MTLEICYNKENPLNERFS